MAGAGQDNGSNVQQWDCLNNAQQQWQLVPTDSGYYQIVTRHSGKTLDVAGISTANGANVHQWASTGGWNQQWLVARRLTMRTSDGTQYSFVQTSDGNFHCIEIKDRNGN